MNRRAALAWVFFLSTAAAFAADGGPASGALSLSTTSQSVTLVDPELENGLAPRPLEPLIPPARVQLPEPVFESNQWRGVQCGVTQPRFAVFRHADKWTHFWKNGMAPYSPRFSKVPVVDFTRDMVVGVFMGEEPDPHYEIKIRSVKPEGRSAGAGGVVVVRYREIHTMSGVFSPPFAVQPFHLLRVSAAPGPVRFVKVDR